MDISATGRSRRLNTPTMQVFRNTKGEARMKKQLIALVLTLGLTAAASTQLKAQDKMSDDTKSQDKMSDDKMSHDKMSNDKMADKKGKNKSKKKMDKMSDDKMKKDTMKD